MSKREIPTITVGQLRRDLSLYDDDCELSFSGLTYYHIKSRGDNLAQVEFNEPVYLDEQGCVVVQNLE
jgi:hypothetical protein